MNKLDLENNEDFMSKLTSSYPLSNFVVNADIHPLPCL
jgi:hypothetical protein